MREILARLIEAYRTRFEAVGIAEADQEYDSTYEVAQDGDRHRARLSGVMDGMFGFDVQAFIRALDAGKPTALDLVISSPGGSLQDGLALYDHLRSRVRNGMELTARVEGIAASAATFPLLAADTRTASESAQVMVHAASGGFIAYGGRDEIEKAAAQALAAFDAAESSMRSIYKERVTGFTNDWLDGADHYFMGQDAVENGLLTGIEGNQTKPQPSAEAFHIAASVIQNNYKRLTQS